MPLNYLVATDRFFGDSPGGAAKVAWQLARLMRREGHCVSLLCAAPEKESVTEVDGVTLVRYAVSPPRTRLRHHFHAHLRAARRAANTYLAGTRWDVVHAHMPIGALATFEGVGRTARKLYSYHSPMAEEYMSHAIGRPLISRVARSLMAPALRLIEGRALRRADQVHTLSRYTRSLLERTHGIESRRIVTLPWWCEASEPITQQAARERLNLPPSRPIVLTVRRLVPRTGVDILIDAFGRIAASNDGLLVIGGQGPSLNVLRERAAALRIPDERIRFLGRVPDDRLRLLYCAADVSVVPTRMLEGFGLVLLEAFAEGCPVIAADIGAIREIMGAELQDWVVPAGDVGALASALGRFLKDDQRPGRVEIAAAAQKRFSAPVLQRRYLSMLCSGSAAEYPASPEQ